MFEKSAIVGRHTINKLLSLVILGLIVVLARVPSATASDVVCDENNPLSGGTVDDVLVVPPGSCLIYGFTVVKGDIVVQSGGEVEVQGAVVAGDILVEPGGAMRVFYTVVPSVIHGDIVCTGAIHCTVNRGVVLGQIEITGSSGYVTVYITIVRGDLRVVGTTAPGIVRIGQNRIFGDLICEENYQVHSLGTNIVPRGDKLGQCASF